MLIRDKGRARRFPSSGDRNARVNNIPSGEHADHADEPDRLPGFAPDRVVQQQFASTNDPSGCIQCCCMGNNMNDGRRP